MGDGLFTRTFKNTVQILSEGLGDTFSVGSPIWGTFSPPSLSHSPQAPSSILPDCSQNPHCMKEVGGRGAEQSLCKQMSSLLYSADSEGQLWSLLLSSRFVQKQHLQ